MKKMSVVIGLIILLAYVGTPFFRGLMMEQILRQSFDEINQRQAEAGSDISVEIQEYDRHVFSSQVEWKINPGVLKSLYGLEEIVLIDRADHGFSSVVSKTSLEKNKWFMDVVNHKLDGKNPLDIQTEYKISGEIESRIALQGFVFKEGRDLIEIKPGQMVVRLDKGIKNIFSEMTWAGCSVPGKMTMEGLSHHLQVERISTHIWNGCFAYGIKKIKSSNGKKPFEMTKMACDTTMDFDEPENKLSLVLGLGMGSVISDRDWIKDGAFKIRINNIDAQAYENFMVLYSRVVKDFMDTFAPGEMHTDTIQKAIEKQMASKGFQLAGASEKLLKKGLEIQVSGIKAQLPQGNIKGDIILSLNKDMTLARFVPIIMQPKAALDVFYLKSDFRFPGQLIGDNPMLLSPIYSGMQTGLFLQRGENMIHKAETRDGKVWLNGKPVLFD
jgi:uncharacterized protein YdgA (DUF945 family)